MKFTIETVRWLVGVAFLFGAVYYRTQMIADRMNEQWPSNAMQLWSVRLSSQNPQMVVPDVEKALHDSNLRRDFSN